MDDSFSNLTTKELQKILKERGLPYSYRLKSDLVSRLVESMPKSTDIEVEKKVEETLENLSEMQNSQAISFKDVEESLESFYGDSKRDVIEWIAEYEDISDMCKWSDIQKYLFARRLLKGAAKLFIESTSNISSWEKLKSVLKEEFGGDIPSINIHQLLSTQKMKEGETCLEFFYKLKQIAKKGKVDDKSLIAYVIAGIPDTILNKTVLFEASTCIELKEKFKVYERMKSQLSTYKQKFGDNGSSKSSTERFIPKRKPEGLVSKRCSNCGSVSHLKDVCPHKEKGARCFACNEFGHIAPNCPAKNQPSSSNSCNRVSLPEMHIVIKCCDTEITALVDTGSDITLMKKCVYDKLQNAAKLSPIGIPLAGFGPSIRKTLGSFNAVIYVNSEMYLINCHIVADSSLNENMLLGKDLLKEAELFIRNGVVNLTKIKTCDDVGKMENVFESMDVVGLIEADKLEFGAHITDPVIRKNLNELISNYSPIKAEKSCVIMKIHLENEIPVHLNPRRLSFAERKIVNTQVEEWLRDGIIENSNSDFASPVVLVKKKDGSNRLCVDYRALNDKIVKDRFPLPVLEDVLERCNNKAKFFSTLDLKNGFFHVDIHEDSRRYTSFVTPDGQYQFLKAPFGLCNSPSVFMRFISTVFYELIRQNIVIIYLDDIIVPARTELESLEMLRLVFDVAQRNGLVIKFKKCTFISSRVEFLGHIIEDGGVKPSLQKTQAIKHFPVPKNVKQVQSFLGLAGFFRKFIQNFSIISKPLSDLTRNDVKFTFGALQNASFEELKNKLCNEPVLKLFCPELETELHTDASKDGFGSCLLQKHNDKFHPVFYISFKTTPAESRYSSYELEVLAIIRSLKKLRVYLFGIKFKIFTDCEAFNLTMKKRDILPKVTRWALYIKEFTCTIHHRRGSSMRHVDALSRYPVVLTVDCTILEKLRKSQNDDPHCQLIKKILIDGGEHKTYVLRSNMLYRFAEGRYLLVVPKGMQTNIIRNIHEHGHINSRKVEAIVRQEYDIDKLGKKINDIISNCVQCILVSRKAGKQEGLLFPIEKIDIPLHTYHVDHLGPLPSTAKCYKHLFVIIDAFTKFVWLYPVKSTTTAEVLKKLEIQREIFGNPYRIISDKGSAFTANDFQDYCNNQKITHVQTTTGIPRGNGQVERINGIIIPVLAKLSIADPLKWYKHVATVQRFINSTTSRSTNRSPFELLFGVSMRNPEDYNLNEILEEEIINEFQTARQSVRKDAKEQILKMQMENRKTYDKKRKEARQYNVDDLVAIQRTQFGTGLKLQPKFLGPYRVSKVNRNNRYEVKKVNQNDEGPIRTSTAADYMKPWSSYESNEESSGSDEESERPNVGT